MGRKRIERKRELSSAEKFKKPKAAPKEKRKLKNSGDGAEGEGDVPPEPTPKKAKVSESMKKAMLKLKEKMEKIAETIDNEVTLVNDSDEKEYVPGYVIAKATTVKAKIGVDISDLEMYLSDGFEPAPDWNLATLKGEWAATIADAEEQMRKLALQRSEAASMLGGA